MVYASGEIIFPPGMGIDSVIASLVRAQQYAVMAVEDIDT
jgi:hypothetical protein